MKTAMLVMALFFVGARAVAHEVESRDQVTLEPVPQHVFVQALDLDPINKKSVVLLKRSCPHVPVAPETRDCPMIKVTLGMTDGSDRDLYELFLAAITHHHSMSIVVEKGKLSRVSLRRSGGCVPAPVPVIPIVPPPAPAP